MNENTPALSGGNSQLFNILIFSSLVKTLEIWKWPEKEANQHKNGDTAEKKTKQERN